MTDAFRGDVGRFPAFKLNLLGLFRSFIGIAVMAAVGAAVFWIWIVDGPAPDQPILWYGITGIGLTRPGLREQFFAAPTRSGSRPFDRFGMFTFWGDNLVYWSAVDSSFAILPPVGPVRWVAFPEVKSDCEIGGLCGDDRGIVATVDQNTQELVGSRRLFRIYLPSGVVQEIPGVTAVQCDEYSDATAGQTTDGRLYLRTGHTRRLLAIHPGHGWRYDFQHRLFCSLRDSDGAITLWEGNRKLWSESPPVQPLLAMFEPHRKLIYTVGNLYFGVRYLECRDYEGHVRSHLLIHPLLNLLAAVPNPRQLEAVERLPLTPRG